MCSLFWVVAELLWLKTDSFKHLAQRLDESRQQRQGALTRACCLVGQFPLLFGLCRKSQIHSCLLISFWFTEMLKRPMRQTCSDPGLLYVDILSWTLLVRGFTAVSQTEAQRLAPPLFLICHTWLSSGKDNRLVGWSGWRSCVWPCSQLWPPPLLELSYFWKWNMLGFSICWTLVHPCQMSKGTLCTWMGCGGLWQNIHIWQHGHKKGLLWHKISVNQNEIKRNASVFDQTSRLSHHALGIALVGEQLRRMTPKLGLLWSCEVSVAYTHAWRRARRDQVGR